MAVQPGLIELTRCPECRGRLAALDDAVVSCGECGRWFPVLDDIPRLLPDVLRDTRADEEFFAAHREVLARLPNARTHFGTRALDSDLYGQFQKQRLRWGKQDRWEDLYLAPVPYAAPNRRKRWQETTGPLRFFSMNLHCEYGTQPRKDHIVADVARGGGKLTLDLGCGSGKNRAMLEANGNRYVGVDVQAFSGPDVQATATMLPFADGTFDFVICDSVLEHVHDPWAVCAELFRVLKPGGRGLFVVPFIYKNHGAPFDFFRYTKSGLHTLLRPYAEVQLYSFGGFFHVVGHMVEAIYTHIPFGVGRVMKALHNAVFYWLNKLDRFDRYRIFCRGYYAVVEKAAPAALSSVRAA